MCLIIDKNRFLCISLIFFQGNHVFLCIMLVFSFLNVRKFYQPLQKKRFVGRGRFFSKFTALESETTKKS